ncbi:hypothetical protein AB1Y20_006840 [Prymnesium parvum]|uniref:Sfi1 spindle body domain-containing protein n=1 Tax=Prymnesium parvum TaxID=97485 RepID=A0AB34IZJ1_PRYPA
MSRATRRVTARVVFVLTNETIARACKIWQEFHRLKLLQLGRVAHSIASYRKQHRLRALRRWSYMRVLGNIRTRVSVRCEAGVVRRAYANWRMVAQLWATVRRVLCRLTRRAVWHAFDAWRADTAVVSRVRKLTYRGINQTVWWAFLIWQEASQQTKAASRALTRASTKLWSVELPQYVKVWRERASFERQARSSVTSAVGHFRSRKLMRSLRSWSAMRRASRGRLQMLRATRELVRARRRRDALQLWANACSGRVRASTASSCRALRDPFDVGWIMAAA